MYFDTKEFGKRLKEIRVIHGLTQEKLAEECSIDLLIAISGHFGVSTDYLLTGKEMSKERNRILSVIRDLTEIAQSL